MSLAFGGLFFANIEHSELFGRAQKWPRAALRMDANEDPPRKGFGNPRRDQWIWSFCFFESTPSSSLAISGDVLTPKEDFPNHPQYIYI